MRAVAGGEVADGVAQAANAAAVEEAEAQQQREREREERKVPPAHLSLAESRFCPWIPAGGFCCHEQLNKA